MFQILVKLQLIELLFLKSFESILYRVPWFKVFEFIKFLFFLIVTTVFFVIFHSNIISNFIIDPIILLSKREQPMYNNKFLTINNQKAVKNSINGNNNTININNSQAIIISIVGNSNYIILKNTSIQLSILGSSNKI